MTASEIIAQYSSDDYGVILRAEQWKTVRLALTTAYRLNDELAAELGKVGLALTAEAQQHEMVIASWKREELAWEEDVSKIMKERDEAEEMCDKLAARIAGLENLEIGEHSSGNCPWQNALDGVSEDPE